MKYFNFLIKRSLFECNNNSRDTCYRRDHNMYDKILKFLACEHFYYCGCSAVYGSKSFEMRNSSFRIQKAIKRQKLNGIQSYINWTIFELCTHSFNAKCLLA